VTLFTHLQSGGDVGHSFVNHADHTIKCVLKIVGGIVEIDEAWRRFVGQMGVVQLRCWSGARLAKKMSPFLLLLLSPSAPDTDGPNIYKPAPPLPHPLVGPTA
jgi:hypothetical protein